MASDSGLFQDSRCNWFCSDCVFIGFQWTVFWPRDVPYGLLGPLGALAKHFVDYHYPVVYYGWFLTWVIHLFEALFALKACSDKGIDSTSTRLLWIAQTFLFGLTSLCLLIKYKPDGRPKRQ
uniref:Transmembrane protein 254 n=1 Tax=Sinocyclocheilus grahami TaxID=75366 RepID=A0A672NW80_SINGR